MLISTGAAMDKKMEMAGTTVGESLDTGEFGLHIVLDPSPRFPPLLDSSLPPPSPPSSDI